MEYQDVDVTTLNLADLCLVVQLLLKNLNTKVVVNKNDASDIQLQLKGGT